MKGIPGEAEYRHVYEELVSELADYFEMRVSDHGGSYAESLHVDDKGRLSADEAQDGFPPVFSVLISAHPQAGLKAPRMTVEEAYDLLRDLMEVMPEHSLHVNDDRKSGVFTYAFQKISS